MINGYTLLNITKLDVLDRFDEICIGVEYSIDGIVLESFPGILYINYSGSICFGASNCALRDF